MNPTTSRAARLLVVDDDRAFRLSTAALLRAEGHVVHAVEDGQSAVAALRDANARGERFDLVLLDLRMPGTDGLGVVESLRVWGERVPILMISGVGTVDSAVRALHLGADDFLTKPVEPDVLTARVADLLERRPDVESREPGNPGGIVGRAPAMQPFFDALRRVAPTETTVLVVGETGTGKELAARAVHDLSPRCAKPFIAVNCAALGEGLLESELFGHVRGAFTGAMRDRAGLFEAASGGTIFLDEVGEVSTSLQQRLLRVLQEREVTRVGASHPSRIDVRVVAATNRDLNALVAAGRFRDDLLYRLAIFPLALPPLRERRADIPLLAMHALARLRSRAPGRDMLACSPFAMRMLREYAWPGNVRQLFSVLEAAAIHADFGRIEAQHLPAEIRSVARPAMSEFEHESRYRAAEDDGDERSSIVAALDETSGALARTAELLGMSRTTLWRKLKQYDLSPARSPDGQTPPEPVL
ncbi:MAG: sigma-54 dependent transcriptional regulator [Gemmatimonadaceae bacterium]